MDARVPRSVGACCVFCVAVQIYDSPSLPEDQATFAIDPSGVIDANLDKPSRKRRLDDK